MELKLTKKEIELFDKNEELIRMNLVSKAIYNESLNYEFTEMDNKNIWFSEENLVLELYMRKKVEPRVMVNENSIIEVYNNNKEYFEKNKIPFNEAREIIKNDLTEESNYALFEDLVKKLMNEMDDNVVLSKEDILFTKGNENLIKSILLINVLKENAKKDNFFKENKEEIELIKKDARLNYYLNKLIEEKAVISNQTVLDEMQKFSKENFNAVKNYSQEELFKYVGDNLLNARISEVKKEVIDRVIKEYNIEKIIKEYTK
ncbi:hypothetical protein [Streptobacillus moniliformis]|uniref:Uncharacterized protein n=1 Tax=Streptobacillus moniliformis (strain ATCC 14647 / DSM 12112 / NCTC 10651 / 9901) TaxID=519441 RepID=D1AXQ3_STRM9|nr:hypothetical protein [Streptobacillus moniliformis]ACZ01079.1 hypothetical protein Smon_0601 [Streptobacillus moniliformis DSM 12112]AVL42555.1 hypothetical protein CEP89_01155 [Streptobacillus moniliformis]SQA13779.1 Uncharacterised protein [Streptobacillus moniliformis]